MDEEKGVGMGKRLTDGIERVLFIIIIFVLSVGAYARNSFWKDEIGLWTDCVRKAPQKERPHHNLGYAYYEKGCFEEAKRELGEALILNPDYTLSWYNLGLVYYRKGMTKEAIDCYEKALDLDSPPPETHYNLGLAYHQKGLYSKAIEAFQTFLEVKPDYRNGYNNLGLAYQRLGRWDEAAKSFQEELRWNPENPYAYLYLGDLYHQLKDDPRALVYYRKALACPGVPDAGRIEKTVSSIQRSSPTRPSPLGGGG
jgi:tetratricopeptide (TPR) repeat protein